MSLWRGRESDHQLCTRSAPPPAEAWRYFGLLLTQRTTLHRSDLWLRYVRVRMLPSQRETET